jgi:oligopeptide/dipeptide ABC transporter ATP-binding protein
MNGLVRADDLRAWYHVRSGVFRSAPVKAVDGVSLAVRRGETLALVGESGCGKTTLGRALLRLLEPTGGTIHFDGRDISAAKGRHLKAFRRRAQAVFQDPYSSISPYMTVRAIVEEPLLIHGSDSRAEREERVLQAIELVKLSPVGETAEKYPHGLSGGQRQRVCIARAMVLEPEFVVADEPVSMVDASNRAEILGLLKDVQQRRGVAFLYITHDIASARHFSDRMAVMYLGTIVETATTGRVIESPLHPYTRGLLASVPEPDPANRKRLRAVIPGEPPSAAAVPAGCPFHPRCPDFMKGRCDLARPELKETEPGHAVACYLYA